MFNSLKKEVGHRADMLKRVGKWEIVEVDDFKLDYLLVKARKERPDLWEYFDRLMPTWRNRLEAVVHGYNGTYRVYPDQSRLEWGTLPIVCPWGAVPEYGQYWRTYTRSVSFRKGEQIGPVRWS